MISTLPLVLPSPLAGAPLALAQIAPPVDLPRWVGVLYTVAVIVLALAFIVLAVALLLVALNAGKLVRRIGGVVERVQQDVAPILKHVEGVTDDVRYISTSLRTDVQQLRGTLQSAQERLTHASATAEQRIHQFNALLEVVQEEAEDLFVDTASTLRGMKAGTSAYRRLRAADAWDEGTQSGADLAEGATAPRHHL